MALSPGARLGPYEITAAIGAGGMGEVFRARDTKLNRDVAIKVLPAEFAKDAERVARFKREAQILASLNHPNIAGIHGLEESDGVVALAMEYVDGEDLSARLRRGAIPVDEAVLIAKQIAEALEEAHEHGIIHRDLKPANIKVTSDGKVKVLDFGLAKAIEGSSEAGPRSGSGAERELSHSPTLTHMGTQVGLILGTAAYMSPEQAAGKPVGKRSDVWSFGVVLLEMLTGRRVFEGETVSHVLAAVLKDAPDFSLLPQNTPASIRRLLQRCLEKDRRRRLDSAASLRIEIEDAATSPSTADAQSRGPRRSTSQTAAVAAVLLALGAGAAWVMKPTTPLPARVVGRFSHRLPDDQTFTRAGRQTLAISADGSKIAYVANQQIYLRNVGALEAEPVRGTNLDPAGLVFSPDGDWIAFFTPGVSGSLDAGTELRKIKAAGGMSLLLCRSGQPYGLDWPGDRIVFSDGTSILSVSEGGGEPQTLFKSTGAGETLSQPRIVDGGRALLYGLRPRGRAFNDGQIILRGLPDGSARILVDGGTDPRVVAGHLLYMRDSTIFAQALKPGTMETQGRATAVVEGVSMNPTTGVAKFATSDGGMMIFQPGSMSAKSDLVWVDRQGRETATEAPARGYVTPRVSPDGERIVVRTLEADSGDLWVWDSRKKTQTRLTGYNNFASFPAWTQDGRQVVFRSTIDGQADVYRRAADGTGVIERLTETPAGETPSMVMKDGRILTQISDPNLPPYAALLGPGPGSRVERIGAPSISGQTAPAVSPDGRWIAYQSREGSSTDEVHVRPFPDTAAGHWQLSSGGGFLPIWSPSGTELFFQSMKTSFVSVSVDTKGSRPGGPLVYGAPVSLFGLAKYDANQFSRNYDISPDGRRFLFVRPQASNRELETITIVTNWFDDLRARMKTP